MLLLGLGVLMAWQAHTAYTHLRAIESQAPEIRRLVLAGDQEGLRTLVETMSDDGEQARRALSGPHWDLVSKVPWAGRNVGAVQGLTEAADELAGEALPELVEVADVMRPGDLRLRGGRVALSPIQRSQPYLRSAADSAQAADERLQGVQAGGLLPVLRSRFEEARDTVASLDRTLGAAAGASQVLPQALGAEGPRRYLVLVQNNAEPRALGGITGSVLELRADRGKVELVGSRPGSSFGDLGRPVLPLTDGERQVYGPALGRYMLNATATPDFPRATELASAIWQRKTGDKVDGALAIDPVTLSELLRLTGPVEVGRRSIDADNAASFLMNRVYFEIAGLEEQDRYFSRAAAAIFDRFIGMDLDLVDALNAVTDMTDEGRFLFWSRDREVQSHLAGTKLGGQLRGERDGAPLVRVHLHDRTQSKMGYYQDLDVRVEPDCGNERRIRVDVTLASRAPANARQFPRQVTGYGTIVPPGNIASQLLVYAPEGAKIIGFTASDGPGRAALVEHDGLQVASWPITLPPGQTVRTSYYIEGPVADATVVLTPGAGRHRFGAATSAC